jgi:hypothetical protein
MKNRSRVMKNQKILCEGSMIALAELVITALRLKSQLGLAGLQ